MTSLELFLQQFNNMMGSRKGKPTPFMVRIGNTMAQDKELRDHIGMDSNNRAEYMGVVVNVVPDFEVLETHKDAFPSQYEEN